MQAVANRMHFALPDFMATNSKKSDIQRPRQLHVSKSFSRADPVPERLTRNQRASTIHNGIPEGVKVSSIGDEDQMSRRPTDAFERSSDDDDGDGGSAVEGSKEPEKSEELPIELASLADR